MKKFYPVLTLMIAIFFLSNSGAPNSVRTQAPGDNQTCQNCHGSATGDGSMTISGVPNPIVRGETYPITITLTDPGQVEGGFQMVATNGVNNTNVGSFTDTGEIRIIASGAAAGRVTHSSPKSFSGGNSTSWTFDWTAPNDNDNIQFYAVGNAVNGNNSTSGDFVYFDNTAAIDLPVEWGQLSARKTRNGIEITWSTLSEINNDYFQIERSINNNEFTTIGKIAGKGNSHTENDYSILDRNIDQEGEYYYRVKQVDFDGKVNVSSITSVQISGTEKYSVYPNPTSGIITIDGEENKTFTIFDASGLAVKTFTTSQSNQTIDLTFLQNGIFYVMDESGNFRTLLKN